MFHDVRDHVLGDLDRDPYEISTDHLIQFFDGMQRNDRHPISLQQLGNNERLSKNDNMENSEIAHFYELDISQVDEA